MRKKKLVVKFEPLKLITCAYCNWVVLDMEAMRRHFKVCKIHPVYKLRKQIKRLKARIKELS